MKYRTFHHMRSISSHAAKDAVFPYDCRLIWAPIPSAYVHTQEIVVKGSARSPADARTSSTVTWSRHVVKSTKAVDKIRARVRARRA